MPTLECLDERSRAILARLDEIDVRFQTGLGEVKFMIDEHEKSMDRRMSDIEKDVLELKLKQASEDGKKSVTIWIGSIALTALASIVGAVGNAIYNWIIRNP